MNRTIDQLACMNGRVYVYLKDEETGNEFAKHAEESGFTFRDGALPTSRRCAAIMAVNHDKTINFVGINGAIAFGSGAKEVGGERLIRVDYDKFINGEENYEAKLSTE